MSTRPDAHTATHRPGFLRRLRNGVTAFFSHDIGLKRQADGVHVVLQERQPRPAKVVAKAAALPSREHESSRREREELKLMVQQLTQLLDELPETRQTMRHLVFVEQAITKRGLRALHKLPVDVLQRGLDQFEGLVTNWSPVGLASLRSKMAVAIIDRDHHNTPDEGDLYRTAAVMDTAPPAPPPEPEGTDDDALAAAYAALGNLAPSAAAAVEMQGDLDSPSARAMERSAARPSSGGAAPAEAIRLRELQH